MNNQFMYVTISGKKEILNKAYIVRIYPNKEDKAVLVLSINGVGTAPMILVAEETFHFITERLFGTIN